MTRAKAIEGLTLQEQRFVEHFMGAAEGNATKAAELAKYKAKNRTALGDFARKLVKKPHIKAAIEARASTSPEVATRIEVMKYLTDTMRGVPMKQISDGRIITAPAQPKDRNHAADSLAKVLRMFSEEKSTNNGQVRIVLELPSNGREATQTIDMTPEPTDGVVVE